MNLLGGKCIRCGWDEDISALEFHHPNKDKEFAIGNVSNRSWKVIARELKKCELLCSNCHRIKHRGIRDEKFFEAADAYSGSILPWNKK